MFKPAQEAVEGGHIFWRLSPCRHHGRFLHPSEHGCRDPRDGSINQSEDFLERTDEHQAAEILGALWERPILKRDAQGIHGTLYYQWIDRKEFFPVSKREVDWEEKAINDAQRRLFRLYR
jgi:hypothetical protein